MTEMLSAAAGDGYCDQSLDWMIQRTELKVASWCGRSEHRLWVTDSFRRSSSSAISWALGTTWRPSASPLWKVGATPAEARPTSSCRSGHQYLELLAVVDDKEALASPQGRPVLTAMWRQGPGLARWSSSPRTSSAPPIVSDCPSSTGPVSSPPARRSDGGRSESHGLGGARRCAFMSWDDRRLHPARSAVTHPNGATGFARLDVTTPNRAELVAWLGGKVLEGVRVSVEAGAAGPTGLFFSSPRGELPFTAPER